MPDSQRRGRTMPKAALEVRGKKPVSRTGGARIETEYIDTWGRHFVVYVEDERDDPALGNIKGPMPLDSLNLPQPLMVRLHNEMYARGLITTQDVMRRPQDVQGAIQSALRLDVQGIQRLYGEIGK